ncbi:MAG: pyruvate kinase, partial [Owenweeksia sp.]
MAFNKTKIIATLGPASAHIDTMYEMVKSGVNVFRINFSHSSHDDAETLIHNVRSLNEKYDLNIAILADLQGPKLRIGTVEEGAVVNKGDILTFTNTKKQGNASEVYMNYSQFPKDVKEGERILLDDGKLVMEITETNRQDTVKAKVVQGGPLKSKKGVNLPNTRISLPCLTEKDLADLKVALKHEVEWIGLSFVRSPEDVKELRSIIDENNAPSRIISKIEKPEAVVEI